MTNNNLAPRDDSWLYTQKYYLAIDDGTRAGFIRKDTGELLNEIFVRLSSPTPYEAHRQPIDPSKPKHAADVLWCESYDGKQTNRLGLPCAGCPAYTDCKTKISLVVSFPENPNQYTLSLPHASAMRFMQYAQKLFALYRLKIEDVVWKGTVAPDKNANKESYARATLIPLRADGAPYNLEKFEQPSSDSTAITTTTQPQPAQPSPVPATQNRPKKQNPLSETQKQKIAELWLEISGKQPTPEQLEDAWQKKFGHGFTDASYDEGARVIAALLKVSKEKKTT